MYGRCTSSSERKEGKEESRSRNSVYVITLLRRVLYFPWSGQCRSSECTREPKVSFGYVEEEEEEEHRERTWRALKVDAIGIKRERCSLALLGGQFWRRK